MTRASIAVLAAGLGGFLLLAGLYEREPLATIDSEVAAWVAANMPAPAEWLARAFSWIGSWVGLLVIGLAVAAMLVSRGRGWDALWVGVVVLGVQLAVTPYLKEAFDRPRPTAGSAVPLPSSDAFPSGHAAGAAATFGLLAVLAADMWPGRRRFVWVSAVLLALAIGASRVVLNVHFVTDVLAGWCFGLAWLGAALLLREAAGSRSGATD